MSDSNVITSLWEDERNIETLTSMWGKGASASEIALALGKGRTRNMVIGKVHRLNLPKRDNTIRRKDRATRRTVPLVTGKKGRSGNPGVPSVRTILHRAQNRAQVPTSRETVDEGVDVTSLIAFEDRRIGKQCAWIPGDPLDGSMCCGKPVKEGTQWCPEHHAHVYPTR